MRIVLIGPAEERTALVSFLEQYAAYNLVDTEILEFDRLKECNDLACDLSLVYTYDEDYSEFVNSALKDCSEVILWNEDSKWAREGIRLHTKGFLLYPTNIFEFAKLMNACNSWAKNARRFSMIKGKNGRSLRCIEIDYVESLGHNIIIHCGEDEITYNGSLAAFEENLSEGFVRCHRSYIANIRHIHQANTNSIIMKNGAILPLSPAKASQIQEIISEYMSNNCVFIERNAIF